jgi:hypothetical protein
MGIAHENLPHVANAGAGERGRAGLVTGGAAVTAAGGSCWLQHTQVVVAVGKGVMLLANLYSICAGLLSGNQQQPSPDGFWEPIRW